VSLETWISEARDHWRRFQPTKFKELQKAGKLNQALREAAERTHREMSELEASGYRNHEAWEMVREKYLFPPQEKAGKEPRAPWASLHQEAVEASNRAWQRLAGTECDE
jgi:hypothetical protein